MMRGSARASGGGDWCGKDEDKDGERPWMSTAIDIRENKNAKHKIHRNYLLDVCVF